VCASGVHSISIGLNTHSLTLVRTLILTSYLLTTLLFTLLPSFPSVVLLLLLLLFAPFCSFATSCCRRRNYTKLPQHIRCWTNINHYAATRKGHGDRYSNMHVVSTLQFPFAALTRWCWYDRPTYHPLLLEIPNLRADSTQHMLLYKQYSTDSTMYYCWLQYYTSAS
jgi:hypothetical protein